MTEIEKERKEIERKEMEKGFDLLEKRGFLIRDGDKYSVSPHFWATFNTVYLRLKTKNTGYKIGAYGSFGISNVDDYRKHLSLLDQELSDQKNLAALSLSRTILESAEWSSFAEIVYMGDAMQSIVHLLADQQSK